VEEKKREIIERTLDIFAKRGIRAISMSEICSSQHISKKTLYKYVNDKNDLVHKCMEYEIERNHKEVIAISEKGLNAIDESFEMSQHVIDQISDINASLFWELEHYYPEAYQLFLTHQNDCVRVSIEENIRKGMQEGYYRADLNVDIVVSIYLTILYNLISAKMLNTKNYSFSEIYRELFKYHTHGISSPKGLEYLKTKLSKNV
jgi:AcrR family transcriptional regulator